MPEPAVWEAALSFWGHAVELTILTEQPLVVAARGKTGDGLLVATSRDLGRFVGLLEDGTPLRCVLLDDGAAVAELEVTVPGLTEALVRWQMEVLLGEPQLPHSDARAIFFLLNDAERMALAVAAEEARAQDAVVERRLAARRRV